MRFSVRVHAGSSREELIKNSDTGFAAYLTKRPQKGQANKALIKLLSKEFNVAKSRVRIVRGEKSRLKTVEIEKGI